MSSSASHQASSLQVPTVVVDAPVPDERPPLNSVSASRSVDPGTARANLAGNPDHPTGIQQGDHHRPTLPFFKPDRNGYIWPLTTFLSIRREGFSIFLSAYMTMNFHDALSYASVGMLLPDPFCRVYTRGSRKAKHGSDSRKRDIEGCSVWQMDAPGKDEMTPRELWNAFMGQRDFIVLDLFGMLSMAIAWALYYVLLWPTDGIMKKGPIRRVADGSIFPEMAASRARRAEAAKATQTLAKAAKLSYAAVVSF